MGKVQLKRLRGATQQQQNVKSLEIMFYLYQKLHRSFDDLLKHFSKVFHRSSAQPNYATTANYQILEFFKLPFSRQRVCIFSWKCLMFQCLYLLASYTRCFDIQRV